MVGPSRTAPLLVLTLALSACGGGSGSTGTPPTATPSPVVGGAFTCPTSETTFGLRTASAVADSAGRRPHHAPAPGPDVDPSLLAVTYDPRASVSEALDAKISAVHGNRVSDIAFDRSGSATRGVFVDASNRDAAAAALRLLPGVRDVSVVHRLHTLSTNRPDLVGPFITNDVIFAGSGVAPLYQTAATEGQWDMHVIGLEHAFDYSQPGNGSSVPVNANALGSTNIKLAVIDTGSDVTHSDLAAANIVRTQCYITGTNHAQSTGTFVTDPDGHGTNVAGIAGDAVNNNFGYAGAGGNISLMLYRVFPTPDSSCSTKSANPPPQCSTNTLDVASAINDAVANGANVINLSFGGDTACTNGQDPDQTEGRAIAGAIAANVIVVAASGNSGTGSVGAPACDSGVIAVGATGWNDGKPNGSNFSSSTRKEYVASYSQYGTINAFRSTSAWGIVAPGGDAAGGTDRDNLHWIDNIWTSTPFAASDGAFSCTDQYGESNCYQFIDGTSMSSPHVAGAAALLLSANGQYKSPAAMFALLCSTADNIGDAHQGCGRLNVYRAMATALRDPILP